MTAQVPRHSREGGNPGKSGKIRLLWIPACAGMTIKSAVFCRNNGYLGSIFGFKFDFGFGFKFGFGFGFGFDFGFGFGFDFGFDFGFGFDFDFKFGFGFKFDFDFPMTIFRLENVTLAFGEAPLLDQVNLQIEARERIFLIGRNGMGKSSLLKVIQGQMNVDEGNIFRRPGLKIAGLSQQLPDYGATSVYAVVASGLADIGRVLDHYHHLIEQVKTSAGKTLLQLNKEIAATELEIDAVMGWNFHQRIETIITHLQLPTEALMNTLSGGWQRRVALGAALVCQPDLLLLDEPTNHLDLAAIEWLENYLADYQGSLLCVTHDRTLLRKLSQRILELDRGKLTSWLGNYDKFLIDKELRLEVEARQDKLFDKKLAKEEVWIRQGIKARRTRNEGRVRSLKKLREERRLRREVQGKPGFTANIASTSGNLVVNAEHIHYAYPEAKEEIIRDFSIRILRGDKIALIGPNGVGKSTLLKILLGEIIPEVGLIQLGTQLQIAYFDQLRSGIDPNLSVIENVAGGKETITINDVQKHVIGYLSDFLFTPERARTPVKMLSGGECNRLLLAKLFSLPSNLLVLDEPTNDLDIESLELLEDILVEYKGTILLVSHDRSFVDAVASSTLFFAGNGRIVEYVGGYSDIPIRPEISIKEPIKKVEKLETPKEKLASTTKEARSSGSKILMNSKMKKELAEMPDKIAMLEEELALLSAKASDAKFYTQDKTVIAETLKKIETSQASLNKLYQRWEELENLSQN